MSDPTHMNVKTAHYDNFSGISRIPFPMNRTVPSFGVVAMLLRYLVFTRLCL